MNKPGRNDTCPCGSGKKFKKCCIGKKPRVHSVILGSSEPLHGVHYDKKKMEFAGLTDDNRLIKPILTYSQIHYESASGKDRVISRVQDKVIPNEAELLRHLSSSFDIIVAMDTNTKVIAGERISAAGIVHCDLQRIPDPGREGYHASFPWQATLLFRNCPSDLSPEKFAWITEARRINAGEPRAGLKKVALVTDHDLGNHTLFNTKKQPVFGGFYLPDNITLMYGRGDGPNENLLNHLVKHCDKESSIVLTTIERSGFYQDGEVMYSVDKIPVAKL